MRGTYAYDWAKHNENQWKWLKNSEYAMAQCILCNDIDCSSPQPKQAYTKHWVDEVFVCCVLYTMCNKYYLIHWEYVYQCMWNSLEVIQTQFGHILFFVLYVCVYASRFFV